MGIAVVRTVILYALLMGAIRIMGKRQLGELQPSELVVALLLSDLAAVPMQDNEIPLANGILPILTLVSLELLLSGLMMKFPSIAKLVAGSPIIVIRDGHADGKAMRRLRLTVDDLLESLRQQNIFDIRQVQYAIVETNGHITPYCYPTYQAATAADVGVKGDDREMPVVVISDGAVSDWGLTLSEHDQQWLTTALRRYGCAQQDVFLMTVTKKGKCFVLTKKEAMLEEDTP